MQALPYRNFYKKYELSRTTKIHVTLDTFYGLKFLMLRIRQELHHLSMKKEKWRELNPFFPPTCNLFLVGGTAKHDSSVNATLDHSIKSNVLVYGPISRLQRYICSIDMAFELQVNCPSLTYVCIYVQLFHIDSIK